MITDERLVTYIRSLDRGNTVFLEELERDARAAHVPVIRREMQAFLKVLLALSRPGRILEVGTAVGFSALLLAEYHPGNFHITTIENDEGRAAAARENIRRAGREAEITLLFGDAGEILPGLTGPFDLIFMDAAKGQYPLFLPEVLRLLAAGGVLVSDNVLREGELLESRFAVTRRNRTIHKRMREYLYRLTHHEELVTAVLPVGDGITVSVRQGGKESAYEKTRIAGPGEQP